MSKSRARFFPALIAVFSLALLLPAPLHAASVSIPSLDLVTRGYEDTLLGVFTLATYGDIELSFDGGVKFGGKIELQYLDQILELPSMTSLTLKGVSFSINELFSLPLSFSWFVGQNDIFCNGEDFTRVFGAPLIASHYTGFMYFPTGPVYDGIYTVKGTGGRLDFFPNREHMLLSLFVYEDTHFTFQTPVPILLPGIYSADIRALMDFGAVRIEGFIGGTYSPLFPGTYGLYRGGLLFYASGGDVVEFLLQAGIPQWDPASSPALTIGNFYLLIEPRLHLGLFSFVPTFFLRPGVYEQFPTGENGSFDVNLDLFFGNVDEYGFRAGLESRIAFSGATNGFSFVESPYVSFLSFGLQWDFKLDVALAFPFTLSNLSGMVGVQASF